METKESKEDKDINNPYKIAREVLEEYERLPSSGDMHDYSYLKRWLWKKDHE